MGVPILIDFNIKRSVRFANFYIDIPHNADYLLTGLYGDWSEKIKLLIWEDDTYTVQLESETYDIDDN